jgi:hypothetical protein
MPDIFRLKIVDPPEPGAARIIVDLDAPGVKGGEHQAAATGADVYCGRCGALLATGLRMQHVGNTVIRCKLCRAYNDPGSPTVA